MDPAVTRKTGNQQTKNGCNVKNIAQAYSSSLVFFLFFKSFFFLDRRSHSKILTGRWKHLPTEFLLFSFFILSDYLGASDWTGV